MRETATEVQRPSGKPVRYYLRLLDSILRHRAEMCFLSFNPSSIIPEGYVLTYDRDRICLELAFERLFDRMESGEY